ncbi:TonB-dependent receptor [Viscerimonas tarda]
MKLYLSSILLVFLCLSLSAQDTQNVAISGTVVDRADKKPVEQASIRFLNAKDSAYVNGTVTNVNGKFSFRLKPGRYIVHASFVGYTDAYATVNANKEQNSVATIELREDGILLQEAVVTAKIAEIVVKGDTIEYNADSYKVQESAVVEDLVKKMPGAEVDAEGKITINGKEVKKILVDGKEFFSDDPKVASKNLPAAMVDKLQVLDRKSDMAQMTGFDDGDEETVINLTVKKGMKQGLFGSATAGMGNKDRYGASGIANYMLDESQATLIGGANNTNNEGFTDNAGANFRGMRGSGMNFGGRNGITESINGGLNFAINPSEKLKWGGNVRYGNNDNDVTSDSYTQSYMNNDSNGDQYSIEKQAGNNKSQNINGQFRFEWELDSLTQIIFSPGMNYGKNKNIQNKESLTRYEDPTDTINSGWSNYYSDGISKNASGRLDVSRKLGKTGRVLSFSLSGGFNDSENDGTNRSETTYKRISRPDSIASQDQLINQKSNGYNFRGYVSYVEPIGKNNFLQLNYSYRKNYSENDNNTHMNDGFGNYTEVDTTATKKLENNFINQEIGLNFKSVHQKYNYTIGFALQPSSSESWTITPQRPSSAVSNDVLNFAPIAQFNYMWDKRHNLRINYNGNTSQPSTTQLSNVPDYSDPLNTIYGNPNLKPEFSNSFNLRYQKFNPEQASTIMAMGGFNFSTNSIANKIIYLKDEDGRNTGAKETRYENVNGNWSANLRMMMNTPLRNKKFSISSATSGSYSRSNGYDNDNKNTTNSLRLGENLGLQFRSDLLDFGLRGNYIYSNTQYSLSNQQDRIIHNYGGNFTTTLYLPYNFTIESDINYSATSGSSEGYDQNEWLWNASIAKQVFKAKNGTIRFKMYDILQQRSNVSQSAQNNSFRETVSNTLTSYFMVSFQYKFQLFKGGAKQPEATPFGGGEFRGPGPDGGSGRGNYGGGSGRGMRF